jgi:uncharacterized protein
MGHSDMKQRFGILSFHMLKTIELISISETFQRIKDLHSKKLSLIVLIAIVICLISVPTSQGQETFPRPTGAVSDFAGIIPAQYERSMDMLAREVLQKTGTAVVVVTLKNLGGNDPADYANRLYEAWGIGKKGDDKGVLILLALKERRIRIETGYGVEGILPDGLVGEILDKYTIPYLKKGDYGGGLASAMVAVSNVIAKDAGVSLSGRPTLPQARGTRGGRGFNLVSLILFFIIISTLLGTRQGRAMLPWILLLMLTGGRGGGGGGFGGFGGGFGGFGGGMSGGGGAGRGF